MGVVAAEALTDLERHAGETYTLTGPEAFTFYQVGGFLTEALSRPIRYDAASVPGYFLHLRRSGMALDRIVIQTVLHVGLRFGQAESVDPTLERLLGRKPQTVAQYIQDHVHLWTKQERNGDEGKQS